MTSPLDAFGLPHDADERALKRAYAQRLRVTRPDEDPQGFQQLHAQYERALAYCRAQARNAGDAPVTPAEPEPSTPLSPPVSTHTVEDVATTPAMPVPVDVLALAHSVIAMATRSDADALHAWLRERPELWSLHVKQAVGWRCVEQMSREIPPMSPACLDILLGFFDLDRVRSGLDAAALAKVARRMRLAWEVQPEHAEALHARLDSRQWTLAKVQRLLTEFTRPFRWPSVLLAGFRPSAVRERMQFMAAVSQGRPDELPAAFDRQRMRFWWDAAQTQQVTRARLGLGLARWAVALILAVLLGVLPLLGGVPDTNPLIGLLLLVNAPMLIWLLWLAYLPLDAWHARPEQVSARWPWLNLLMVPLLCLLGAALKIAQPNNLLYLVPMLPAAWLALRRYWRRSWTGAKWASPNVLRIAVFLAFPLLRFTLERDITCEWLALLALVPWGLDVWHQRTVLRVTASRA